METTSEAAEKSTVENVVRCTGADRCVDDECIHAKEHKKQVLGERPDYCCIDEDGRDVWCNRIWGWVHCAPNAPREGSAVARTLHADVGRGKETT